MKRFILCLLAVGISAVVHAQIPNIIPYQGSITDTSGLGFDGDFDFEFRILDNNASYLWASGLISVSVNNGNYSVSLGSGSQPAIAKSIFDNDEMYLEIPFNDGINGKEPLTPNVRILAVP
ncbi:MAG: hypothetical protein ACI9JN_000064 [Bacteroidia bacterium]|jgi:hypothetical protein